MRRHLIAALCLAILPWRAEAWIAYGYQSGTSRFDIARQLSEKESLIVIEDPRQTVAAIRDEETSYDLVYCASPQRLYLMRYRFIDSPAAFVETLEKFEKRYGRPEGLNGTQRFVPPDNWADAELSLIWVLNDAETILLSRNRDGVSAEFQDVSVCR